MRCDCSNVIQRGSTPTIRVRFDTVPVSTIVEAILTIMQGETRIEKNISDATVGEKTIDYTLTQTETLKISAGMPVQMQCRWKTASGVAGGGAICSVLGGKILRDGVI